MHLAIIADDVALIKWIPRNFCLNGVHFGLQSWFLGNNGFKIKLFEAVVPHDFKQIGVRHYTFHAFGAFHFLVELIPIVKNRQRKHFIGFHANHHHIAIFAIAGFKRFIQLKIRIAGGQNFRQFVGKLHLKGVVAHKSRRKHKES